MDKTMTMRGVILVIFVIFHVNSERVEVERSMKIFGGSVARVGQFPHAAALILHLTESRSSFCGGSIINANFILTVSNPTVTKIKTLSE